MKFDEVRALLKETGNRYIMLQYGLPKSKVLVAPDLQGRVLCATVDGDEGECLGWVNESMIRQKGGDPKFNNYGGAERIWLGPEGGQFSYFFQPGESFSTDAWKVPPAFNETRFQADRDHGDVCPKVMLKATLNLSNYSGTDFSLTVTRRISAIKSCEYLASVQEGVKYVGFESSNAVKNIGERALQKSTGLFGIWTLGQFVSGKKTTAILPFKGDDPAVNDKYFGDIPKERLRVKNNYLLMVCDGQARGKIGLPHNSAKEVMGSIDFERKILTVVEFNRTDDTDYVNSKWEVQDDPYSGDVTNVYNDGPLAPGQKTIGGFYELESSSPALELEPGKQVQHVSTTHHFVGEINTLSTIAMAALNVDLKEVKQAQGW